MKKKRIFTTWLVILTFIAALILTLINSLILMKEKGNLDNEIDWAFPIIEVDSKVLDWPIISTEKLSKSIIDYNGKLDLDLFKEIFLEEFFNFNFSFDESWITFDYKILDNEIEIIADSNLSIINGNFIKNPTKIYRYKYLTR